MNLKYENIWRFYRTVFGKVTSLMAKEGLSELVFPFIVFFLSLVFAIFIVLENNMQAAAIALAMAVCDIMATLISENKDRSNTSLISSILLRYSELVFYTALMVYALQLDSIISLLFIFLCFATSFISALILAKAKNFDLKLDWGLLRRPESIALLAIGLFFGIYGLLISSIILALVSNTAAFYYLWYIYFHKST